MKIKINLPAGETVFDGKVITFKSPCTFPNSGGSTVELVYLVIDGQEFRMVGPCGADIVQHQPVLIQGAFAQVLLNGNRAYLQNPATVAEANHAYDAVYASIANEVAIVPDNVAIFSTTEFPNESVCDSDGNFWKCVVKVSGNGGLYILDIATNFTSHKEIWTVLFPITSIFSTRYTSIRIMEGGIDQHVTLQAKPHTSKPGHLILRVFSPGTDELSASGHASYSIQGVYKVGSFSGTREVLPSAEEGAF